MKGLAASAKELDRVYGTQRSKRIQRRMTVLMNAGCLEEVPHTPPERRHQLKGGLDESFAVDVDAQTRIIFKPNYENIPRKEDGGINLAEVKSILITHLCEDYH